MEERIIDKYLSENITPEIKLDILKECTRYNSPSLLKLFSIILNSDNNNDKDYNTDNIHNKLYELIDSESYPSNFKSVKKFFNLENEILSPIEEKSLTTKRVLMLCNWSNSKDLCDHFNIMSKNSDYTWNNIEIVWEEPADFYCIINSPSYPTNTPHDPDRTIIFQMEPNMFKNEVWGDFSNPREDKYLYVGKHFDPGHRIRIDFMRFLESKGGIDLDIFGKDNNNWKNYKGSLPSVQKDDSLLPYKYTFNCENNYIRNYFTEKIHPRKKNIDSSSCVIHSFIIKKSFFYNKNDRTNIDHNDRLCNIDSNCVLCCQKVCG